MIEPMVPDRSVADAASQDVVGAVVSETFESFYRREIRSLVGLAYVLSGSRGAADDLAQDALLAAYRHWDRVSRYENPGGWVRRVVANRSVSVARRRLSESRALMRFGGQRVVLAELSPESEELWSAVRGLPRRQAQVIALPLLERARHGGDRGRAGAFRGDREDPPAARTALPGRRAANRDDERGLNDARPGPAIRSGGR